MANELKKMDFQNKFKAHTPQNALLSNTFRTSYKPKIGSNIVRPRLKKPDVNLSTEINSYIKKFSAKMASREVIEK